jgi:hypothetical protein
MSNAVSNQTAEHKGRGQLNSFWPAATVVVALYVASYFARVQSYGLFANGPVWRCPPGYGFCTGTPMEKSLVLFYAPIHKLDRVALRPWRWSGTGTNYPPEWQWVNHYLPARSRT